MVWENVKKKMKEKKLFVNGNVRLGLLDYCFWVLFNLEQFLKNLIFILIEAFLIFLKFIVFEVFVEFKILKIR